MKLISWWLCGIVTLYKNMCLILDNFGKLVSNTCRALFE